MKKALFALLLAVPALTAATAMAQQYPSKPIVLVVPFAPGGTSELISRLVAQKLTERLGQQVVVENRPGAAGNIAMEQVARAAPDGYTLILGHIGTLAVNPAMFPKLPYDAIKDFAPVSLIAAVPNIVTVNPAVPAKTLKEFLDLARAKPGSINYGSAGNGSAGHLAMEYLKRIAKADMVHVPYKGTGPMLTDLLAGQTQATFTGSSPLIPHIKSGKLRALAVGSAVRIPSLPEVPTVAESGFAGFETAQWYGIIAPAKTPPAIIQKLSVEIAQVMKQPDVIGRLSGDGTVMIGSTPSEFAAYISKEMKRWGEVVHDANIKAE
jgi:tripartite-type tricarboxylate transporter receptor subunit TctC